MKKKKHENEQEQGQGGGDDVVHDDPAHEESLRVRGEAVDGPLLHLGLSTQQYDGVPAVLTVRMGACWVSMQSQASRKPGRQHIRLQDYTPNG